MKRGEIWTVASGSGYSGKPRPAVIVQDDRFDATDSITICPVTTDPTDAPLFRPVVTRSDLNGLRETSRMMADKIITVPRSRMGRSRIGYLAANDMINLNRAISIFLGLIEPGIAA